MCGAFPVFLGDSREIGRSTSRGRPESPCPSDELLRRRGTSELASEGVDLDMTNF